MYPKIFKVPHHGSLWNSIALQKYIPKKSGLTKRLLATLALLQIALENDYSLIIDQIKSRNLTLLSVSNQIKNIKPSKRKRKKVKYSGNTDLHLIAQKFNDALKSEDEDTESLLKLLKTVCNVIKANVDRHNVDYVNVYTNGISDKDKETLTKFDKLVYTKVKEMLLAYKKTFSVLEEDHVFRSKIYFNLNRAFYSKINAQTYIISAGKRYSHPNWEVVNGIIAAAHDQRQKDAKYKCRLIITSRKNIRGDKLQELALNLNDDWTKYVSLQCFDNNTISVEINPNEVNPVAILDGALPWEESFSDNILLSFYRQFNNNNNSNNNNNNNCNKILQNFYQRKGAQELKISSSAKYEISPYEDETLWLSLQHTLQAGATATDFGSFELKHTKTQMTVERLSVIYGKSIEDTAMKFTFSQPSVTSVKIYGKCVYTPNSNFQVVTCKLYAYTSNGNNVYMVAKSGILSSTTKQEYATVFQFTKVPLTKQDAVTKHLESSGALTESTGAFQLTAAPSPKAADVTKTLRELKQSSNVKVTTREDNNETPVGTIMQLEQFFGLVQYRGSSITCEELLHIIVSQQFISQFLTEYSDTSIGNFILDIFHFRVDGTSTFMIQDFQALSANIKLILPSKQLHLNHYTVNEVTLIINDPKTLEQKVNLRLMALDDDDIPVAITYHFMIKTFVRYFQKYLVSLGISKNPNIFKMYDALILLLQSDFSAFVYLSSLSRKMIDGLLEWSINEEASSVEFLNFPTGPLVMSADIIAKIPEDGGAMIDLELSNLLKLTRIGFTLPSQLDSSEPVYLFANAVVVNIELQITAYVPDENTLPKLEVSLAKPLVLKDIISLLQIDTTTSKFMVPLMSKALEDVCITEAGFTYQQVVQNSQQVCLESIHFGISFTNLNKYLPPPFSNLNTISSRVVIYQPKLSFVQIGLEVGFEFSLVVSKGKAISLTALFATEPVMAGSNEASSYNFTVSIEAKSDNVGTAKDGVTLDAFLGTLGLAEAFSTTKEMPFLNSILANIELKQLVLTLNTSSRDIKAFILELLIFNWIIIPDKVVADESCIHMSYINNEWMLQFDTTVVLNKEYHVNAHFELSDGKQPAKFAFTNSNDDLTISKFLAIFGLGSIGSMPVVEQFLNISVNEVTLQMSKDNNGTVIFNNGSVLLYSESIEIGTLFTLSQVTASIGFILDSAQDKYIFKFGLNGFINDKIYLDVEYDGSTSVLSGQILISSFSEGDLSEILAAVRKEGTETVNNNAVYKEVSQSFSVNTTIAIKHVSNDFKLTDVVIHLDKVLSIGPFSLQNLRFEYHNISSDVNTQSQDLYRVAGELTSGNNSDCIGALLEFDLTKDSTEPSTVKASLRPTQGSKLTLKNLLSSLNIPLPSLPEIVGQKLPSFFDIALTRGTITLSVSPFNIIAFQVEIETTKEVIIMDSPVIKLNKISLMVDYNKNPNPVTKATLLGIFCIGGFNFILQGSKVEKGIIFTMTTNFSQDPIGFQESIDKLTPKDNLSPKIPTNIGIPENLKFLLMELVIKQLYSANETSLLFIGISNLDWIIDIGFQQFTVKQLGGRIFYHKSSNEKTTVEFEASITGKFQFTEKLLLTSELQFKAKSDTVLSILATGPSQVTAESITDDVLGFNHLKESRITFQSLLPNAVQSIKFSNFFININFTQSILFVCGELASIGHGFLIAGKLSSDTKQYGYALGISLSQRFKFSDLVSALSPIDEILTIEKANCIIVSLEKVKVEEVMAKMEAAKKSAISSDGHITDYPFTSLNLDSFTNNQELMPGLSIYGEINFNTTKLGSLFNSIIRISQDAKNVPNIIVSAMISNNPIQSKFKAYIAKLILFGAIEFSDITFSYTPANKGVFELTGTLTMMIGKESYSFVGNLECSYESSKFSVSPQHELVISEPLGMFGITLQNAMLVIKYDYRDGESLPTSSQAITADVNFYSKNQFASNTTASPSVKLKCSILFKNFTPTVVSITWKPDAPLTIADLVMNIFGWEFDADQCMNIGFVNGQMYYAKPAGGDNSVSIDGIKYDEGYHISADIKIFTTLFTIQADILTKQVSVRGFAHSPLKFGFAKFTGVDVDDPSKSDESKSPEVTIVTKPNSTSISLDIGFVLFGESLGTSKLEYKSGILYGKLTYHGSIGFIENPSICFEWSEENGFKITEWPVAGSFKDAFDFISKIQNYKDACGDLVNLVFKETVQTQFNINIKLSKTKHPKEFLADIDITGTYDVLLLGEKQIASIPIPDISVRIPIEDNFTLKKLPKFILDLFRSNSKQIIEQITKYPERLVKIIAVSALKTVTKEVIGTLVCRGVNRNLLTPEGGGTDVLKGDYENANKIKTEFYENAKEFDLALKTGGSLGRVAADAALAGIAAIGIFAGIAIAACSILSFFNSVTYQKREKEANKQKKEIEQKLDDIKRKIEKVLDIKQITSAAFTPPDNLLTFWKPIEEKEARYHVKVVGSLLTSKRQTDSSQTNDGLTILYEEIISDNHLRLQNEKFYDAVSLKLSVNGTLVVHTEGHTYHYDGPVYTKDVSNVHPTLRPPSNMHAVYCHSSLQISTFASPVEHAKKYYFELVDKKDKPLTQCTVSSPSTSEKINSTFSHSVINVSSSNIFKVRGQARAESELKIASSTFGYSNELTIVSPIRNLCISLPHFGNQNQTIDITWDLPISTENVYGFLYQAIEQKSNKVVLSKEIHPPSTSTHLPISCGFKIADVTAALVKLGLLPPANGSLQLKIQISALSNSELIIDSIFTGQLISSLPSPQNVTCGFSAKNNTLAISWTYIQMTKNYGLQIKGLNSEILFSELVTVKKTSDIEAGRVVSNISLTDLQKINDPSVKYAVEVISVAEGNDNMDSLVPAKAASTLKVLKAPVIKSVKFNSAYTVLNITVAYINNVNNYQVDCIVYDSNNSVLKETSKDFQPSNNDNTLMEIDFNSEVEEWESLFPKTASVNVTVTAIGSGYYLTSKPSKSEYIKQQSPPTNIKYLYSSADDMITIACHRQDDKTSEVVLGLVNVKLSTDRICRIAKQQNNIYTVTITGQDVRDEGEKEWFVFAQCIGNSLSLPSSLVTLTDPVNTAKQPQNQYAYYDETNSTFFLNWSIVGNVKAYRVIISYESTGKVKSLKLNTETTSTSLTIDVKRWVPNWASIFSSVTCVVITIVSMGMGLFINSNGKDLKMNRTPPPSGISYSVNEADLTVSWDERDSTLQHNVTCNGNYGLLKRLVENSDHCTLQKRFLLYPSTTLCCTTVDVNVIAKAKGCLPSIPIIKQVDIQAQMIIESKIFGVTGGKTFDDGAGQSSVIIGMQSLVIYHDSSICGLEATYFLDDGSVYKAASHGGQTGHQTTLKFDKQESIIAVSAMSSSVKKLGISQLVIITQKVDGSYHRHGPYGTAMPEDPEEQIKLSGNIFVLKGRCNDNFISAIGFKFTYAHPIILASELFGGDRGLPFDEHILTHIPRVVGIKSIQVEYHNDHISTIQLTHLLQGGNTCAAPTHGTQQDNAANLQFEDEETVIQVKVNKTKLPVATVVKQLSLRTQKRDGTIATYNFSPVGTLDNPTFTLNGIMLGLYGYSGWYIDSLGLYYSLLRTELFGGSGGSAFDVESITNVAGIKAIKVWSSNKVASIEVTYLSTAGSTLDAVQYGNNTESAELNSIEFEEDEEIVQIYIGTYNDDTLLEPGYIVGMLKLVTQMRDGSKKEHGPYGCNNTKEFTVNGRVVAFFGRCGSFLDAIGMYYIPF